MKKQGEKNPNYRGGFKGKCATCDKDVWVTPTRSVHKNYFCSKPCEFKWKSENTKGEAHWRWQGGPVGRTCEACGKDFLQRRAEFNRKPGRFCSGACRIESRKKRVVKACELCLAEFSIALNRATARFCSQKCKKLSQVKVRTARDIARRRLNARITSLMGYALKGKKAGCKWEALVGYTLADLMQHMESKFQQGMTWENIGDWHIDHIQPRCSFSYELPTDEEFQKCWALENLQPLWAVDNLRKGSKPNTT